MQLGLVFGGNLWAWSAGPAQRQAVTDTSVQSRCCWACGRCPARVPAGPRGTPWPWQSRRAGLAAGKQPSSPPALRLLRDPAAARGDLGLETPAALGLPGPPLSRAAVRARRASVAPSPGEKLHQSQQRPPGLGLWAPPAPQSLRPASWTVQSSAGFRRRCFSITGQCPRPRPAWGGWGTVSWPDTRESQKPVLTPITRPAISRPTPPRTALCVLLRTLPRALGAGRPGIR